jgi:hypothetical protein
VLGARGSIAGHELGDIYNLRELGQDRGQDRIALGSGRFPMSDVGVRYQGRTACVVCVLRLVGGLTAHAQEREHRHNRTRTHTHTHTFAISHTHA